MDHVEDAFAAAAAERARRRFTAWRGTPDAGARGRPAAGPLPGLLAIARLLRERREALFAAFDREWRAGGVAALGAEVRALASGLSARPRAPASPRPSRKRAPRLAPAGAAPPRAGPRARRRARSAS
jgi:hypothetical protein